MVQKVTRDKTFLPSFEKLGKNHVPTCPIFTGPVTYNIYYIFLDYNKFDTEIWLAENVVSKSRRATVMSNRDHALRRYETR